MMWMNLNYFINAGFENVQQELSKDNEVRRKVNIATLSVCDSRLNRLRQVTRSIRVVSGR